MGTKTRIYINIRELPEKSLKVKRHRDIKDVAILEGLDVPINIEMNLAQALNLLV